LKGIYSNNRKSNEIHVGRYGIYSTRNKLMEINYHNQYRGQPYGKRDNRRNKEGVTVVGLVICK
jgi:hypothetical protein